MKNSTSILVLSVLLTCSKAFAQDTLSVAPPQIAQVILAKLDHEVSLSAEQEAEVLTLLQERAQKFSQIKQGNGAKRFSVADFKQANEQALTKLQAILSTEQFAKLKALRQADRRQKAAYKEEDIYKSLQDIELDF